MPTRHQRHRSMLLQGNDDGLGLAEILVSVAVVLIVLISAGAAFVRMGEAQRSAEATDRGTQMIQDRLETIRKLRWDQVGCYDDDPCPVSATGEVIVRLGPTRPLLGPAAPKDPTDPDNSVVFIGNQTSGNKYTVRTVASWAGVTVAPPGYATNPDLAPYAAKRVTVTASWTAGTKTRTVSSEWLRSPTPGEDFPPNAGTRAPCPETVNYPFCTIGITEGNVLVNSPTFNASRDIAFTVRMSAPINTARISFGTIINANLTVLNGGVTDGGKTFTYVLPAGSATGVKPGPNTVTITVTSGIGTKTVTKVVNWRFPVATASPYQLANLHGISDSLRDVSTNLLPPTGSEPARTWFCVKITDNTLWRYTAVVVDETNVDEMDRYTPPKLYASGMDPAGLTPAEQAVAGGGAAVLSQHPSATVAGYTPVAAPVGGYVGTQKLPNGSLNTIRWSYGFQPGTKFPGTTSTIIISGERPADGAAANASLTMPVYAVPYATDCPTADKYVPLKADLSGTATGSTNTLTWTAPYGADSYELYRVGTALPIYSGTNLTAPDSGRPWGLTTSYYVVAYKGAIVGPASTTLTLTTGPGPSVLSGPATGQTNNLSWTAATGADSYKLYRVGTALPIYSGTNLTAPDSGRPLGLTTSYYVVPYLGSIVGANSNTHTLTTLPGKPATPSTTTNYWNFTVWCPTTTGATSNTIRRYDTYGTVSDVFGIAPGAGWQDPNTITHATSTNYWCAGVNSAGTGTWSDPILASGYNIVPAAPTGLYLSSAWGLAHTYVWSAVPGATQYWLTGSPVNIAGTTGTLSLATDQTYSVSAYAYSAYGRWSAPSVAVQTDTPLSRMAMGGVLRPSWDNSSRRSNSMVSPDGQYVAILQVDGNFVIYGPGGYTVKRQAGTYGEPNTAFVFQGDGHPVLYRYIDYGAPYIAAIRYTGVLGTWLQMNNGGNFVLYNAAWTPVWTSDANVNTLFRP